MCQMVVSVSPETTFVVVVQCAFNLRQSGPSSMSGILNPYLTNGFSNHYQLGEFTFIFSGVRSDFYFYLIFR